MNENTRILAVKIDSDLFDGIKKYVRDNGITMHKFVTDLVENKLRDIRVAQDTSQKGWNKQEVENAINDFIEKNGRVPKQTEYRNENGLPSYGAAGRMLGMSPAEYAQDRLDNLISVDYVDETIQNNEFVDNDEDFSDMSDGMGSMEM